MGGFHTKKKHPTILLFLEPFLQNNSTLCQMNQPNKNPIKYSFYDFFHDILTYPAVRNTYAIHTMITIFASFQYGDS